MDFVGRGLSAEGDYVKGILKVLIFPRASRAIRIAEKLRATARLSGTCFHAPADTHSLTTVVEQDPTGPPSDG